MLGSIDSISLVHTYRRIPSPAELRNAGWLCKPGRRDGTLKWINNSRSPLPNLTIYEIWDGNRRLRADVSIPRLLFGSNLELPNASEIDSAFETISINVAERSGLIFEAKDATMCRIDYALNHQVEKALASPFMAAYTGFNLPRMLRKTVGDTTIYFENCSQRIRIYDKLEEMRAKREPAAALDGALIRIEHSLPNLVGIRRYVQRKKMPDATAKTLCSSSAIEAACLHLAKLLRLERIDLRSSSDFDSIYAKIRDLKKAMNLSSFLNAHRSFGPNFYKNPTLRFSKSTYDRRVRELSEIGIFP